MKIEVGTVGYVGWQQVDWVLGLVCGLLLGIAVLLAVLWFRARHRLHAVHSDLRRLQQQVVGLSDQLREAEQRRQSELQQLAEQRQWAEQQLLAGQRKLARVSAPLSPDNSEGRVSTELADGGHTMELSAGDALLSLTPETVGNQTDTGVKVQSEHQTEQLSPVDEQLLERAKEYIEKNLSRSDLSVEEVSEALGVSRVHLYKKLSSLKGRSPIEYIRYLRLQQASELLRTTLLPIGTVSSRVGIPNQKHFSRYFKEEFGMVPTTYRRTFSKVSC